MDPLVIHLDRAAKSATATTPTSMSMNSPFSDSGLSEQTSATAYSAAHLLRTTQHAAAAIDDPAYDESFDNTVRDKVEGWPRVAQFISQKPGLESFSRFRELNIKNLLYYQVELSELESQLSDCERFHAGNEKYKNYAHDGRYLMNADASDEEAGAQWELVCKIRKRLKQYNQAMLLYKQFDELPEPDNLNVETLRVWLRSNTGGHLSIRGPGSEAWGTLRKEEEDPDPIWKRFLMLPIRLFRPRQGGSAELDLVTMPSLYKQDAFVRWISHDCVPLYHDVAKLFEKRAPKDEEKQSEATTQSRSPRAEAKRREKARKKRERERKRNGVRRYSEKPMQVIASSVATLVACVLPTVAIGILTTAEGRIEKLLYIGGFTMLFAIGLMLLTDCGTSRIQIFTATAAFSAVLVVFVQNQ